ncbi:MAG: hypothetical protein LBM77_10395 [Spirochaetaceae bacterium]|jgi:hypothetical protein|nr:hypothetical protein [Spirochaetaceae bacterium]
MISGYTTITVPGESFKINIPVKTMVVGTEFLAIDGTVYEQGRLQKTVGLYKDSNYRVQVTLGSGQNDQKVTGNGISPLLEAQNAVAQGLIYNHGLSLVSNKGYYNNLSNPAEIEISGNAIIKDFDETPQTPQVYQYTFDTDAAIDDDYSFYFNMEYKPFGFTETAAWADVYTAGLTTEAGPVWVIRNGRNDYVQDDTDTAKGAIPLSVVELVETTGLFEGNNPASIDLTKFSAPAFDGTSAGAYEAALNFFNTPAVAEAAQYGSYTVVVGGTPQALPRSYNTKGNITLGASGGAVGAYPEIKNIMLNFRSKGAQTWYPLAYQVAQGTNRVSYGTGITEFDITLIDLSVSDPRSLLQSPYYTYTPETNGGFYTISTAEPITVINRTTDRRIKIAAPASATLTANVTLKNAEIDLTLATVSEISAIGISAVPAIDILPDTDSDASTNTTLNLTLVGSNTLTGANAATYATTWKNNGSGAGIHVPDSSSHDSADGATKAVSGSYTPNTAAKAALTINGGGDLTVWGGSACAGIGGNSYEGCGKSTVASSFTGSIIAGGGQQAAGIGGGFLGNGGGTLGTDGSITIAGGTVTAYGGIRGNTNEYANMGYTGYTGPDRTYNAVANGCGAAIGGGSNYNSGTLTSASTGGKITISGGTVTANGVGNTYYGGAGIGGGNYGAGGTILISIGTVVATGGKSAAGIGGGYYGEGGTTTISGGTVFATSKEAGAGIGSGISKAGGTIEISGGTVVATGGDNGDGDGVGAGIGGGQYGAGGTITISGTAIVMAKSLVGTSNGAAAIGGASGPGGGQGGGTITIRDSAVVYAYAEGASNGVNYVGAVIGGGRRGAAGNITISSTVNGTPTVVAIGGSNVTNSIGNGGGTVSVSGTVTISGGTVIANKAIGGSNTSYDISGGVIFASGLSGTQTANTPGAPMGTVSAVTFPDTGTITSTKTITSAFNKPNGWTFTDTAGGSTTPTELDEIDWPTP